MKVAMCQVNPTVGDFAGNVARVLAAAGRARGLGADLAVFPEMVLTGYPPRDLLERKGFVSGAQEALVAVARGVEGIACVVGTVEANPAPDGRPLFNCAAVVAGGQVASTHRKSLLPSYDVFDEDRYFEPAREVSIAVVAGRRVGVTICEDLWHEGTGLPRQRYHWDPVERLVALGADLVVNLSASPFHVGKDRLRYDLMRRQAERWRVPFVLTNQVGGNDELVFDGNSFAMDASGRLLARAAAFEEDVVIADIVAGTGTVRPGPASDVEAVYLALVLGLSDYVRKCGFSRVVVGLSGGIDSALVAVLAAAALGPENVTGVAMPGPFSSACSEQDAAALASRLGIAFEVVPITSVYEAFLAALDPVLHDRPFSVTEENLQARARGTVLMGISNRTGALLLTTGNKSEVAVGYCTLYGDMAGGLAVISDVPKTLVYALARWVNRDIEAIPARTISRPPSAELRPDQKDSDSLPDYEVLDHILAAYVEEGCDASEICARGFAPKVVSYVIRLVEGAEYKRRQSAPGLKVTSKAFGSGRRVPIARARG